MKRMALLSSLVIAGSLVVVGPVEADAVSCEDVYIESYDVTVKVGADAYDLGDRARIALTVTRKDTGDPAQDVRVAVALGQDDPMSTSRLKTVTTAAGPCSNRS